MKKENKQNIDSRIDAKNAKFWVLFSDSKFKDLRKQLVSLSNSNNDKVKDAKEKVAASLYVASKAKQLNESMNVSGVETFTKDGQELFKVNGKVFDNFVQDKDKVIYFNGAPRGFDGLSKIISNPPSESEIVSLNSKQSAEFAQQAVADIAKTMTAAREGDLDSGFLWMSQKTVDNVKQEVFGSETEDEIEKGYGLFDAVLAMIPGSKAVSTVLKGKTLAAPIGKKMMASAASSVIKYGAADAAVGGTGIALTKAADAITQDDAEDDQNTKNAPTTPIVQDVQTIEKNVTNDVTLMQKTASMASSVGSFMKSHAVTIGSLAAITVALIATRDKWVGYLKKLWPFSKKYPNVVAKSIFKIDGKECTMSFDVDEKSWQLESKQLDKKEIAVIAKQLKESSFFNRVAERVLQLLDTLHKSFDFPEVISHLTKDKTLVELVEDFKSKWPNAKNSILEINA